MRIRASINTTTSVDDRQWRKMVRNLSRNSGSIEVGWWSNIHPSGVSLAQVAKWNEEGHITGRGAISPARPFVRVGFMDRLKKAGIKDLNEWVHLVAIGRANWKTVNTKIGEDLVKQMQLSILEWNTPRNSPYTVALKGFDDPLIETGTLYDRVKFRVVRRGK